MPWPPTVRPRLKPVASRSTRLVAEIYAGPKAGLQPIHDRFMVRVRAFGPFEVTPKKGHVSLRRKKQFAMIGPATKEKVEIGLNMKGVAPTARLIALPPGGMWQYKLRVAEPSEVDDELIGWAKLAFVASG